MADQHSVESTAFSTLKDCHDCAVKPGQPHQDGCDTARCTLCGWQRISCDHEDDDGGWGEIWTGEWPGDVECREFGLWSKFVPGRGWVKTTADDPEASEGLNELAMMGRMGEVVWNGQRWVKP